MKFLTVEEKYLSKDAINILSRVRKRYNEVKPYQFVYWCIMKNIDIKISSEIIINNLNLIRDKELLIKTGIVELLEKLQIIINKERVTYRDENKAYEIMSDIVFILEKSYNINRRNNNEFNIYVMLKKLMKWLGEIFKIKQSKK